MAAVAVTIAYTGSGRAHSHIPLDGTIISAGIQILTGTVAVDTGDYPTNGFAFDITAKMPNIITIIVPQSIGYKLEYDAAAKKMKIFYSDLNGANDGPDIEYPAAACVACTWKWVAIGKID